MWIVQKWKKLLILVSFRRLYKHQCLFSSKHDVEYFFTTFILNDNEFINNEKEITSYNLKFNSGYYPERYDPSYVNNYTQLVIRIGGLYSLMLNNGFIYPSVVCHKFGWNPSKKNPKVWINKERSYT